MVVVSSGLLILKCSSIFGTGRALRDFALVKKVVSSFLILVKMNLKKDSDWKIGISQNKKNTTEIEISLNPISLQ